MDAAESASYDDEDDRDEEPDGQLLLEIIRKEEDRDLRQLVWSHSSFNNYVERASLLT